MLALSNARWGITMNHPTRLMLAVVVGACAVPALAAEQSRDRAFVAPSRHATDTALAPRTAVAAPKAASVTATPAAADGQQSAAGYTDPGTPVANGYRAYPPSCAAWPLPDTPSGPTWSGNIPLYTRKADGNPATSAETVKVTVWRISCSSSGSGVPTPYNGTGTYYNAMTFLRIERSTANNNRHDVYPTMPYVQIKQYDVDFTADASLARLAVDPNTVTSELPYDAPLYSSTTFVLENYPYGAAYNHQYSNGFVLRVNPNLGSGAVLDLNVPAYQPQQGNYPYADGPMFLDGYAAAQWINYDRNEGLILQVPEQYDASGNLRRQLVYNLLTKDTNGNPFWIVGNGPFNDFDVSTTMPALYLGNGSNPPWGTAKIQMVNCNELDVTLTPNSNLPAPVPSISGTIKFQRLYNANGMVCE